MGGWLGLQAGPLCAPGSVWLELAVCRAPAGRGHTALGSRHTALPGPWMKQELMVHPDTCISGALSPVKGAWCRSPPGTPAVARPTRHVAVRAPVKGRRGVGPRTAGRAPRSLLGRGQAPTEVGTGTRLPSQGRAEDSRADLGLGSAQDCSSWPRITAPHGAVCFPCPRASFASS